MGLWLLYSVQLRAGGQNHTWLLLHLLQGSSVHPKIAPFAAAAPHLPSRLLGRLFPSAAALRACGLSLHKSVILLGSKLHTRSSPSNSSCFIPSDVCMCTGPELGSCMHCLCQEQSRAPSHSSQCPHVFRLSASFLTMLLCTSWSISKSLGKHSAASLFQVRFLSPRVFVPQQNSNYRITEWLGWKGP